MNWYIGVLKKYAVFSGRARRKEYWMFTLFDGLILLGGYLLIAVLSGVGTIGLGSAMGSSVATLFAVIYLVYNFGVLIPKFAVTVRRLHDINVSGFAVLLGLIPVLGGIALFVMSVMEGTYGPNQYGFDPKMDENDQM